MKAFAVVDNDCKTQEISLIQDDAAEVNAYGIYEDIKSAKEAADYYTDKDQFECGLQEPYSVVEIEISFGKKVYSSKFE
jgi:hypothetical protein